MRRLLADIKARLACQAVGTGQLTLGHERASDLRMAYRQIGWDTIVTQREYLGNLFILDILDRYIGDEAPWGPSLDVGSARWWYLPALASFRPGPWTGVELPPRERGLRRCDWQQRAEQTARSIPEARYKACCLTQVHERFRFITWFLPYVALPPLLAAGLPLHRFDPAGLLRHVYDLLDPGGVLFVVNQGEPEAELQRRIFESERLSFRSLGEMISPFTPFTYPRFGWLLRRP